MIQVQDCIGLPGIRRLYKVAGASLRTLNFLRNLRKENLDQNSFMRLTHGIIFAGNT
jgi:hypothetical protein